MATRYFIENPHSDPGLQPERTSLAWGRTMLAMMTVGALSIRWLPIHGLHVFSMVGLAFLVAVSIFFTQRKRYRIRVIGFSDSKVAPDVAAVLCTAATISALGLMEAAVVISS